MSALLEAVRDHAAMRRAIDADFREAVRRAREQHAVSAIADAAGMTRQGIYYVLRKVDRSGPPENPGSNQRGEKS